MINKKRNIFYSQKLESVTYRKILEYIQKEGIEPFERLFNNLAKLKNITGEDVMADESIVHNNEKIIAFLSQFNKYFMDGHDFTHKKFQRFISHVAKNMDQLDVYVKNIKKLEAIKVDHIDFISVLKYRTSPVKVWHEQGQITRIEKKYTDGIMEYNLVKSHSNFSEYCVFLCPHDKIKPTPTWLLEAVNHETGEQERYLWVKNLAFNGEYLPTNEELSLYEEPQTLKLYKSK